MPSDADVIVAGAGPAGAVAALRFAQAGRRVVLCDKSQFPRDKACGDGLIADTQHVLEALSIDREVKALAHHVNRFRLFSPGGIPIDLDGEFWVLPRRTLDALLVSRAEQAGATFRQMTVESPVLEGTSVVGVAGRDPAGARVEIRAPLTVLATGANAAVLTRFDPEARATASGFAVRAYAEQPPGCPPLDRLMAAVDNTLPGYAWAFPTPGGVLNVGVGVFRGTELRAGGVNLRKYLHAMLAGEGTLGRVLGPLRATSRLSGAPLRTSLSGSSLGRPGLAIVGDAAGTTYALSGEGIGKAMESAMLLADLGTRDGVPLAEAGLAYRDRLVRMFSRHFHAYAVAERWITVPFMADYVARRARGSQWIRDRLSGLLAERVPAERAVTLRALWHLVTHP